MENNQNNAPAEQNGKKENHNQRRSRRHHRGGHRPRPDAAAQNVEKQQAELAASPEQTEKKTEERANGAEGQKNHNRHNRSHGKRHGSNHSNGKGDGSNGDNQEKRERQGGKQNRRGGHGGHIESRPYDPYEEPSRAEIELSELRAQIVLKAADGSIPTAYTTPQPHTSNEETTVQELAQTQATPPRDAEEEDLLSPAPEVPTPVDEPCEKVEVVGVRFRSSGKMYYFDPRNIRAKKGEFAIVETARGPEFGEICLGNCMVNAKDTVSPLRPLLRIASPADIAQNEENCAKEKKSFVLCQERIAAHKLEMKLIDAQYAFDGSKLLFYFTADGRVDFRELVKDLASLFRTRIELRQIGIRDEAKMLGGIGACGRPICCATFLPDFAQVSIKMAKDQNLSLNSNKISGVCGRLMCCLRYEEDVYVEEIRKTPANDSLVKTEDGIGVVIGSNPLAGTIKVLLKDSPDTPPKQYHRDNVTLLPKEKKGAAPHDGKTE